MDIVGLLIAMAVSIFGVAIGALASFIFVGVLILVAVAIIAGGGSDAFLGGIAFGAFGPHVAGWASGVAAAAFAGKKGKLASGRDCATPGMGLNSPDVLAVGMIFGGLGYIINWLFSQVGFAWTDTIALTVVVSAIIARLAFGKTGVFGKVPAGQNRFARPQPGTEWLPWQSDTLQLLMIGLGGGALASIIAKVVGPENGGTFIGFAISASSLVFLFYGSKVPVTHHITLVSAVAFTASGSLVWGLIFGLIAAFVGEFMSRAFLIYGDTHIDPPACTIAALTSLSILFNSTGIYSSVNDTLGLVILAVLSAAAVGYSITVPKPVEATT
jgi:hypothetical protein